MLTGDLVRVNVRNQVVRPSYVKPGSPAMLDKAAEIIQVIASHEGETRGELDDALNALTGRSSDFKVLRGFAKLVLDKTTIDVASDVDPKKVRAEVFERAAAHHPVTPEVRARIMTEAGKALGLTAKQVEEALFADLAANQRVGACPKMTPVALLNRYNVALAQAVLLKSQWVRLDLENPSPKRVRQLIRHLKFHRLMYEVERRGTVLTFKIDGPASIVRRSNRYGMALANFLPALLLQQGWSLQADYQKKKATRRATFELTPAQGLVSHYKDTGTWVADEEKALIARLREKADGWTVDEGAELVDLDGRGHLVPDLVLRDPSGKRVVYVEVVWRWRRASLKNRWSLLGEAGPGNLILALCTKDAEEAPPELAGAVHVFKGLPNVRTIWKLARGLV